MEKRSVVQGKVVLIGEERVGKTSWLNRTIHSVTSKMNYSFNEEYNYTSGVVTHKLDDGIYIWDTAGKSSVTGLVDGYYLGAEVILIFIQVNNAGKLRLDKALNYYSMARDVIQHKSYINPGKIIFVINKIDRAIKSTKIEIENFRSQVPKHRIICISAKTGEGCKELYDCVFFNTSLCTKTIKHKSSYILGPDGYAQPIFV